MMTHSNHPFHLVNPSPWPLTGAISTMIMLSGMVKWFHLYNLNLATLGSLILILTVYQWWRDVSYEGTMQGLHSKFVTTGLRWGMILFIVSELLFFASFFWAFFHSSLSPNIEINSTWPPSMIMPFNPFSIPLLNTTILLSSGISVTWAHHALLNNNHQEVNQALLSTIIMGIYFTMLQAEEYMEAPFTISDSIYGSTFYIATGFHGIHVLVGTTFLIICLIRHLNFHYSSAHHFGFEAAAWYWHFVDVIWLFLYISIYWWGN